MDLISLLLQIFWAIIGVIKLILNFLILAFQWLLGFFNTLF